MRSCQVMAVSVPRVDTLPPSRRLHQGRALYRRLSMNLAKALSAMRFQALFASMNDL